MGNRISDYIPIVNKAVQAKVITVFLSSAIKNIPTRNGLGLAVKLRLPDISPAKRYCNGFAGSLTGCRPIGAQIGAGRHRIVIQSRIDQ
jgi:hypothetical protein